MVGPHADKKCRDNKRHSEESKKNYCTNIVAFLALALGPVLADIAIITGEGKRGMGGGGKVSPRQDLDGRAWISCLTMQIGPLKFRRPDTEYMMLLGRRTNR